MVALSPEAGTCYSSSARVAGPHSEQPARRVKNAASPRGGTALLPDLRASERAGAVGNGTLSDPDLYLALLAIRNEFLNLSELKHCLDVRKKLWEKSQQEMDLGDVLVQQRYLTPQDLEYVRMIAQAEPPEKPVQLAEIEAEFDQHVAELKPGVQFSHYRIEDEIGRGGMGIVLRAVDLDKDEQECALKILIGGKDASVRDIERFKKEATVMAPLLHDGIVKIYEVGRHRGLDFISMEFIDGVSLKELVGEAPVPDEVALAVVQSAANAVGFMHTHGIIHRDIKPENIMVRPDGSAVLMDFGLAGWDKIEILAGRGSIGTPMYQPPEQADVGGPFGKISAASDVYGLGATLYFLLTARHPFLGRNVKEVREKIKTQAPDPPKAANPDVHPAVEGLCLRCLKKRQNERFGTPKELAENIDKVLDLLIKGDSNREKLKAKVQRRIAQSLRKSEGTGKKSEIGKAIPTRRSDMGRVTPGAIRRSDIGKVGKRTAGRSSAPRTGPQKRPAAATNAVNRAGSTTTTIILVATAVVGLLGGALLLFAFRS